MFLVRRHGELEHPADLYAGVSGPLAELRGIALGKQGGEVRRITREDTGMELIALLGREDDLNVLRLIHVCRYRL
jgi:hypothetical protein